MCVNSSFSGNLGIPQAQSFCLAKLSTQQHQQQTTQDHQLQALLQLFQTGEICFISIL